MKRYFFSLEKFRAWCRKEGKKVDKWAVESDGKEVKNGNIVGTTYVCFGPSIDSWCVCKDDEAGCTQKIIITSDGKTTTARLFDGEKNAVKTAKAVCADSDTFDFITGSKIAFERLTQTAEEKKPEKKSVHDIFISQVNPQKEPAVKEVHRKAKAGEYIKILTDGFYGKFFTVGKVYKVEETKGSLARIRKDDGGCILGFAPHEYVVLEGYKPDTEPEKKQDKPKYLNGKVVCIKTDYPWWTVGKVYDVKDGIIAADDGDIYPKMGAEPYKSYEDIRHAGNGDGIGRYNPDNEFIEFKG